MLKPWRYNQNLSGACAQKSSLNWVATYCNIACIKCFAICDLIETLFKCRSNLMAIKFFSLHFREMEIPLVNHEKTFCILNLNHLDIKRILKYIERKFNSLVKFFTNCILPTSFFFNFFFNSFLIILSLIIVTQNDLFLEDTLCHVKASF